MATPVVYEPKRLIPTQHLVAQAATLYTCPGNYSQTQVTEIILQNTGYAGGTPAAINVTLYLVLSGQSAQPAYFLLNNLPMPTDGTPYILEFSQLFLNIGDRIMGKATRANEVTIHISGVEMGATSTSTTTTSTSSSTSTSTSSSTSTTTTSTSTSTTTTSTSTTTTSTSTTTTSTSTTTTSTSTTTTSTSSSTTTSTSTSTTSSTSTSTTTTSTSTSTTL